MNEDNLGTLPPHAPEGARKLAERITLASRRSTLEEWLEAFSEADNSIHPTFNGIGAWTHRMSHAKPNGANIPGKPTILDKANPTPVEQIKLQYNMPMRSLWEARPKRRLVGVDADAIQLRILAHYMDDPVFTEALVNGKKEEGTDAHTLNAIKLLLGKDKRDVAKTFIYAWVLNAGIDKIAQILNRTREEAREAEQAFLDSTPALKHLKEVVVPVVADKGFFKGLDGRLVPVPSAHKVLAGFLQNGESTIMKKACVKWRTKLKAEKVPFWHCNFVHDEWQTEVEDNDEVAEYVAKVQADSIRDVGVELNMKCPLAGSASFGYNWAETH